MLKTRRGVIKWYALNIITLGIYACVFISKMAKETNITCAADKQKTRGFFVYFILSILTLGLYAIIWNYRVTERHAKNLSSNEEKVILSGVEWFLWNFFGILLLGLGPIIAMYKQIKQWNKVNKIYNASRPEQRSMDRAERKQLAAGSMKSQQAYGSQRSQPAYGGPILQQAQGRGEPMPYNKFIMPRYAYMEQKYNSR